MQASNVIDVGYSGVIGAERIVHGQAPWGNFPIEGKLKACGPADAAGEIRERIQTNGRCESANPQGDTYGPVAYESYIPGYLLFGWSGKWDSLPAAHFTSIAFDVLCMLGLWLVGRRFGGAQLGAMLAFAWAAYPFTQYASSSNTNDALLPCFLIWGFWLVSSPVSRGALCALSGLHEVRLAHRRAALAHVSRPAALAALHRGLRGCDARGVLGRAARAEPAPRAARLLGPHDPLAGRPRCAVVALGLGPVPRAGPARTCASSSTCCRGCSCVGALVVAFVPRHKSPLQLAALTAALLAGFELCLTYWLYTYIPWFFGFAAIALLAPAAVRARAPAPAES